MKNTIEVKYVEFEPKRNIHFGPIEVAYGRINGHLWFAESYYPSRNAIRAWRVHGTHRNIGGIELTRGQVIQIAKAINAFENKNEA